MIHLDRVERRVQRGIWEWTAEDDGCRCRIRGNAERLDTETPSKVLDSVATMIALEIALIPRHSKWCLRDLDHEDIKIGIRWQTRCENSHVFGIASAVRFDRYFRMGVRHTNFGTRRHHHIKIVLV